MTDKNTDRPLVTFAVFAYNQEQYIRDAVDGAFAQTYEPLEIILSDDCSTDRTYQIMQEMAAAYDGPHEVRVRKNEVNLGTALHVYAVSQNMNSELLVVAAGDDISLASRVSAISSVWTSKNKTPSVIHSAAKVFSDLDICEASSLELRYKKDKALDLEWYAQNMSNPIIAPTAAYSKRVFENFPPLFGGSVIEDGPLCLRCFILGELTSINEELVMIRRLDQTAGTGYKLNDATRWNNFLRSRMISQFNQINDLAYTAIDSSSSKAISKKLRENISRLSSCVIEAKKSYSVFARLAVFWKIFSKYPIRSSYLKRLVFAITFCELIKPETLRHMKIKLGFFNVNA